MPDLRSSNVIKQVCLSFLVKIISIVSNFLLIPLMLDVFSKSSYGIWLTIYSIVTWFAMFDIGLGNGLRNKLTIALSNNDFKLGKKYISTTYVACTFIFLTLLLLFYFINYFLNWQDILNNTSLSSSYLRKLTNIIFTFFFLRFIFQLVGVVFMAFQRPVVNNWIIAIGNIISIIVLLLAKNYLKNDLILCSVILMGVPLLIYIFSNVWFFSTSFSHLRPSFRCFDKSVLRQLFALGGKFFIVQVSAVIIFSTSNLLVTQFYGSDEVVIYNSAFTLFQLPVVAYGVIMLPIWSAVTDAISKNDNEWLSKCLKKLNLISIIFCIGIFVLLIASPYIYQIWLGKYIHIPLNLSCAMAIYAIINVILSPYTSFINGLGKINLTITIVFFTTILFIPVVYIMSHIFDNSASIIVAICIINGVGLYFQPKQVSKLINNKAFGIWNK